jgi:hypothetical protein
MQGCLMMSICRISVLEFISGLSKHLIIFRGKTESLLEGNPQWKLI